MSENNRAIAICTNKEVLGQQLNTIEAESAFGELAETEVADCIFAIATDEIVQEFFPETPIVHESKFSAWRGGEYSQASYNRLNDSRICVSFPNELPAETVAACRAAIEAKYDAEIKELVAAEMEWKKETA